MTLSKIQFMEVSELCFSVMEVFESKRLSWHSEAFLCLCMQKWYNVILYHVRVVFGNHVRLSSMWRQLPGGGIAQLDSRTSVTLLRYLCGVKTSQTLMMNEHWLRDTSWRCCYRPSLSTLYHARKHYATFHREHQSSQLMTNGHAMNPRVLSLN